jgi:hypothetical protein B2_14232
MDYFKNVQSMSELKARYRKLVLANHPDKGGDTKTMQIINEAFEKLFKTFQNGKPASSSTSNGYENDFNEARTASEYTQHVYEEYGWTGKNFFTYDRSKIIAILREWLKKTYPQFTFTVNKSGYRSINIHIMTMDFCPWQDGNVRMTYQVRRSEDKELTERAQDIVDNIQNYMNSFNYDHSDSMTDYFDRNFYDNIEFGNRRTPFKVETVRSRRMSGETPKEFKWKDGPAHIAVKKALNGLTFGCSRWGRNEGQMVLGRYEVDYFGKSESGYVFYSNDYNQPSVIRKKIQKLQEAGILCEKSFSNIRFMGYTEELEKRLAAEDRQKEEAFKEWQQQQQNGKCNPEKKENTSLDTAALEIQIIDYSEKAIAVIGNTKPIANKLQEIGGRFNSHLSCGPGWIFSKKREEMVRSILSA